MNRPNFIDWLIYKLFRWWWNPVLRKKPLIVRGLITEMEKWYEDTFKEEYNTIYDR